MGPSTIRYAGVIERLEELNIEIEDRGEIEIGRPPMETSSEGLRYLRSFVKANKKLATVVNNVIESGSFPLIFGGDHSMAIGTLAGVSKHYNNLGVIWYDAHGDINNIETSPTGNIHGMPLAVSMGIGHEDLVEIGGYTPKVKPENNVIIEARSLDDGEKK